MIVCICGGIKEQAFRDHIKELVKKCPEAAPTNVRGTNCGTCTPELRRIAKEVIDEHARIQKL